MTFIIGIDADSTMYDLMNPWLDLFSQRTNRPRVDVSTVKEYNPHLCLGEDGTQLSYEDEVLFYSLLEEPGLFEHLPLYKGAKEAFISLSNLPDTLVYIVSAPNGPQCAKDKLIAFKRDFPFLNKKNIMLVHHKHHLNLDVMIDDSTDVIKKFSDRTLKLGIMQPWNINHSEYWHSLVASYQDTEKAWDRIVNIIRAFRKVKESHSVLNGKA